VNSCKCQAVVREGIGRHAATLAHERTNAQQSYPQLWLTFLIPFF